MRPLAPYPSLCLLAGTILSACASTPDARARGLAGPHAPDGPAESATAGQGAIVERVVACMGTGLTIEVNAATRAEALAASEQALRAMESCAARLSTWTEDSELSRLTAAASRAADPGSPQLCSKELTQELGEALRWAAATDYGFDPSVGALVQAWDLRGAGRRPSPVELQQALEYCGPAALHLEGTQLTLRPGTRIEEGGFGKGAALDAAREAVDALPGTAAMLDLGGQVSLSSRASARRVPLAHPDRRDEVALWLELRPGESLATSANTVRALPHPEGQIGHLLDPRSGQPAEDFGSVTVLCTSALAADALSTGLFILGPNRALDFAKEQSGIEVLLLERVSGRLRLRASGGLLARIHPENPELQISGSVAP